MIWLRKRKKCWNYLKPFCATYFETIFLKKKNNLGGTIALKELVLNTLS